MGLGYSNSCRTKAESVVILVPSLDSDDDKWCPMCKQYKSKNEFYMAAMRYDGLTSYCKVCDNIKRKKRDGR